MAKSEINMTDTSQETSSTIMAQNTSPVQACNVISGLNSMLQKLQCDIHDCQLLIEDVEKDIRHLLSLEVSATTWNPKNSEDIRQALEDAKERKRYHERLVQSFASDRRRIEDEIEKSGERAT